MASSNNKPVTRLHYFRWRWLRNFSDTIRYLTARKKIDKQAVEIIENLRRDGIAEASSYPNQSLLMELESEVEQIIKLHQNSDTGLSTTGFIDRKKNRDRLGKHESKDFLQILTPERLAYESIFLRYALQQEFVDIASSYLGLNARLRAIHLWLNKPTDNEPVSTQLWHRDGDDLLNVKIFTYLTDVGPKNGPFAFIPGTHPFGYRPVAPEVSDMGRTNDTQMKKSIPESEWKICTGKNGSVIFADTCGYHKGVKPVEGYRLMLMVHFTSRAALSGNELQLEGTIPEWLSDSQRLALDLR